MTEATASAPRLPNPEKLVRLLARIIDARAAIITNRDANPDLIRTRQAAARDHSDRQLHRFLWLHRDIFSGQTALDCVTAYKVQAMEALIKHLEGRPGEVFDLIQGNLEPTAAAFDRLVGYKPSARRYR